jgi:hypothetical protein
VQKKTLFEIKQEEQERIACHTKAYLARGNQIKVYPAGVTGVDLKKMNEVWEKKLKHKKGESI